MKKILFNYYYNMNIPKCNLGDHVQTLAVKNVLEKIDELKDGSLYFDRDSISLYNGEKAECVMQGWWSHSYNIIPQKDHVIPTYVGYHMTMFAKSLIKYDYYKNHLLEQSAIGCRDKNSRDFLFRNGVDNAYFSRCLTLTFDKRKKTPKKEKIFFVDKENKVFKLLPSWVKKNAERINQQEADREENLFEDFKNEKLAENLLKRYKEEATLVVTTALHVANPCIAMGIPVVLISNNQSKIINRGRFDVLEDLIPVYTIDDLKKGRIDWNPVVPNIEDLKKDMIENVRLSLMQNRGEKVDAKEIAKVRDRVAASRGVKNLRKSQCNDAKRFRKKILFYTIINKLTFNKNAKFKDKLKSYESRLNCCE